MARLNLVIGNHPINDNSDCYMIVEIGHNHEGTHEKSKMHEGSMESVKGSSLCAYHHESRCYDYWKLSPTCIARMFDKHVWSLAPDKWRKLFQSSKRKNFGPGFFRYSILYGMADLGAIICNVSSLLGVENMSNNKS